MTPVNPCFQMPLADILDRMSIAIIKKHVANLDTSTEIEDYRAAAEAYKLDPDWLIKLLVFNALIWSAESDIRKGRDGELGLAEVGRRAIDIRNFNSLRMKVKEEISKRCGERFDVKVDHASVGLDEKANTRIFPQTWPSQHIP